MKDFLKSINWWYLIKYELIVIVTIGSLYTVSKNKFPEKIEYAILLFILWTLMVFTSAFSNYILNKNVTKQKDLTYSKKNIKNNG